MTPLLFPSSFCVLILVLLGMGVLFSGDVAFATIRTGQPSKEVIEPEEDEFFDAEEYPDGQNPKFPSPPSSKLLPQSGKDERGYWQWSCDAVTGTCGKVYNAAGSAASAAVDAAGAPIRWAGAQAVRGASEEAERQLQGPLGTKTIPGISEASGAAAVVGATEAVKQEATQKVVAQTANTAAQGAVQGAKDAIRPGKRKAATGSQDGQPLPKKSRTQKFKSAAMYVPRQISKGAKKAGKAMVKAPPRAYKAVKRKITGSKAVGEPVAKKQKISTPTPVSQRNLPTKASAALPLERKTSVR